MPWLVSFFRLLPWLFAGIVALAPTIMPALIRIGVLSLGLGTVTFLGVSALFDAALDRLNAQIGGLPADLAALVDYLGVFDAVSIVTAAVSVRVAMTLIGTGGSLTRYRVATKIPPVFRD